MNRLIGFAALLTAPLAFAHEGHGLRGTHWHATDSWGFVTLGLIVVAAWWVGRRK